jgi:hypothetical protein
MLCCQSSAGRPPHRFVSLAVAPPRSRPQVGDPDFAIVDEAYPYIAKRLLTDDSPRLQEALR